MKPPEWPAAPDYDRQTINHPNPIAQFVHRQRHAVGVRIVADHAATGSRVLDFGCGVGAYLRALHGRRADLRLFGYDPYSGHIAQGYTGLRDVSLVPDRSIDIVTAFETLEHMTDAERERFYLNVHRVLSPGGRIVVSVPLIGGPTLAIKKLNRLLLFRRLDTEYTWRELLSCVLTGKPCARTKNLHGSHKGFDYRTVRTELQREFEEHETFFTPFRGPALVNSQMFWIGRDCWPVQP